MTFDSAINSLSDGKAARFSTWGGYIFRTDIVPEDFSVLSSYVVNDLVRYGNKTYICAIATSAGEWNEANWLRAENYTLTFRKRLNKSGNIPNDTVYTYTPGVITEGTVHTVSYTVEPDGSSSSEYDVMLPLDGTFLQALRSSDWSVGKAVDFEAARIGTGSIW